MLRQACFFTQDQNMVIGSAGGNRNFTCIKSAICNAFRCQNSYDLTIATVTHNPTALMTSDENPNRPPKSDDVGKTKLTGMK